MTERDDRIDRLVTASYDRQVEYMLRDEPYWRKLIADQPAHPVARSRRQRLRSRWQTSIWITRMRLASLIAGFDVGGWDES